MDTRDINRSDAMSIRMMISDGDSNDRPMAAPIFLPIIQRSFNGIFVAVFESERGPGFVFKCVCSDVCATLPDPGEIHLADTLAGGERSKRGVTNVVSRCSQMGSEENPRGPIQSESI